MIINSIIKVITFGILFIALGCQAESNKIVNGIECRSYVDLYLSFHDSMISKESIDKKLVLINTLNVHPEDVNNTDSYQSLLSAYVQHESEILEVSEYYASCKPEKKYASLWFKITDKDPKFNRLYIVISEGKINTLSKELASSSDKIDSGKSYINLKDVKEKDRSNDRI